MLRQISASISGFIASFSNAYVFFGAVPFHGIATSLSAPDGECVVQHIPVFLSLVALSTQLKNHGVPHISASIPGLVASLSTAHVLFALCLFVL